MRITDSALVAAASLSNRYISDRFLPDKAIDLVDEAASRLRMEVDSKPEELDELDREILQKQIEREALKKGDRQGVQGPAGKTRRPTSARCSRKSAEMNAEWQAEKDKLSSARGSRNSSTPRASSSSRPSATAISSGRSQLVLWRSFRT